LIFDIVKAGLAGSHNRLIHTTLKTDRIRTIFRMVVMLRCAA